MAEELAPDGGGERRPALGDNPAQEPDGAPEQGKEPEVVAHSDDEPARRWYIGYDASPQGNGHPSEP
jgi:hypothetical protein